MLPAVEHISITWHSVARHGVARHGVARHGVARHGVARHGVAQHGISIIPFKTREMAPHSAVRRHIGLFLKIVHGIALVVKVEKCSLELHAQAV